MNARIRTWAPAGAALVLWLSGCATTGREVAPMQPPQGAEPEIQAPVMPPGASSLPAVRSNAPARHGFQSTYPEPAVPAGLPLSTADRNSMVAHFINVGQGDATLLEFQCGAVLIDTGGENTQRTLGRERLRDYLEAFFARRADLARTLNLVVLSHPHADHTDGVKVLLDPDAPFAILNVIDNGEAVSGSGKAGQAALQRYVVESEGVGYEAILESKIKTVSGATSPVIDPIDCRTAGGIDPRIAVLWGQVNIDAGWADNQNNDSVVVRVDFGKSSFLFTGDAEHEALSAMLESYEDDLRAFDVDVLKVGHHGSKNAISADFLRAVTPKMAIIQAGDSAPDNETFSAYAFAHPNKIAVDLLRGPDGVSSSRPRKDVRVGVKGRARNPDAPPVFTNLRLDKAVYNNGWDGDIAVTARADGALSIETEF